MREVDAAPATLQKIECIDIAMLQRTIIGKSDRLS
jgi:hypothetical protein